MVTQRWNKQFLNKTHKMVILQIEHAVPDFDGWRKAFNSDPVNRKESGVRRHRILRPTDNPNYVIIDLEFDSKQEAEALYEKLLKLWQRVEGKVMMNPKTRIIDIVENKEY